MRKLTLLLLGLVLSATYALAQRTITGKVADEKGNPLPNVSVVVKNTTTGTTTRSDGSFSISIPASARVLVFSSVDMAAEEVAIGSGNTMAVTLKGADKSLTEVVVTGYTREKRTQFTGAASTISGKVVETVPVGSFDQALQGRAPGLLINSGSGQPGTSANINIRGIHSIQAAFAQPLIIVDGVPLPAGDMQTINPNDFESITVLKDASAAALYGARGGLGVIVITTKKGKNGQANFTYRAQVGFTQPPNWNKFDMMNTKEILQYEEMLGVFSVVNPNVPSTVPNTPGWVYSKKNPGYNILQPAYGFANVAQQQAYFDRMLDSIGNINTDYRDYLFRNGLSQTHEINVSAGSDKTRFFISGGMFDQKGTEIASRLRRYTTRFNLDHTAGRLNIAWTNSFGYSITNYTEGETRGNSALNSFQMSWRAKPYEKPYRADGSLIFGANSTMALKQIGNVLETVQNSSMRQNQIKINSGLTLSYKILSSLTIKNTLGIDVADDRWQRYIKSGTYIGSQQTFGKGINSEAYKINAQLINTTALLFAKKFMNKHEVDAGAYFEVIRNWQKGLGFTLYNLDPRIDPTGQNAGSFPTAQTQQFATSASGGYGIRSYFGTVRYTFNNKYTINANIRRDATSRILKDENKHITTWSAGAIWNAMEETFMKSQTLLTDLKLRASYGIVPNIGSIPTQTYASGGGLITITNYLGPQFSAYTTANYANSPISGQAPLAAANSELKIERIEKLNLGIDFAIWKNRARFTVDWYNDKTKDLFVNNQIPATSGFGSGAALNINAGVMQSTGFEFTGAVDIVKTRDWDVTFGINHSINKNEIVDLGQVQEIPQGTFIIREGLPYGSHYATNYLGADPATGRPRFYAQDGKTIVYDAAQAGLFATFGTFLPKHTGGFTFDVRYSRISLSALFSYQFDVSRYNNIENWVRRGIIGYHASVNASRVMLTQQWFKPGDNAFYQSPAYDRGFSSSDIQDAKFLRFRNLNVAYNIPELNIGGTRIIKSARFYVQLQNIAVWSPWRGPDPEDSNNISLNEFPNPRMFVTGIDINF